MNDKEWKVFRNIVENACHRAGLTVLSDVPTSELVLGPCTLNKWDFGDTDEEGRAGTEGLEGWLRSKGCHISITEKGEGWERAERFLVTWHVNDNCCPMAIGETEAITRGKAAAHAVEVVQTNLGVPQR